MIMGGVGLAYVALLESNGWVLACRAIGRGLPEGLRDRVYDLHLRPKDWRQLSKSLEQLEKMRAGK